MKFSLCVPLSGLELLKPCDCRSSSYTSMGGEKEAYFENLKGMFDNRKFINGARLD